jgi:hypothetical protein
MLKMIMLTNVETIMKSPYDAKLLTWLSKTIEVS